jgi:CheY-like chemotaxis protein
MVLPARTILVAEDDPAIRLVASQLLLHGGYEVVAVTNGLEALRILAQRVPALILSDIRMPGCTGLELLQHVRSTPAYAHLPFILVSAITEPADIRMGMSLGADDYVTKPFNPEALLDTIAARLRRAEAVAAAFSHHREFFTHTVPHELRSPLTVIMGYADLLLHAGEPGSLTAPGDLRDYGRKLMRSSQRLLDAVEDFTLWGQIESAASKARLDPAAPIAQYRSGASVVRKACETCADEYGRRSDLFLDLADAEVIVPTPGFARIVTHLVRNAFKFSLPGSPVEISSRLEESHWTLDIRDGGRGMKPDELAQLNLQRPAPRQHNGQTGLGLGLSLAHRFVHLVGGQLALRTREPAPGLHVTMELPLSRPVVETASPFPSRAPFVPVD